MEISKYSEMERYYPDQAELEIWLDSVRKLAREQAGGVRFLEANGSSHTYGVRHHPGIRALEIDGRDLGTCYGYWQPAHATPAPLLVHVPGYGAEMSIHPELVVQGYNVLHVSPLGYATPSGPATHLQEKDVWPVLQNTIRSGGERGYREWLAHCVIAIEWALSQEAVAGRRVSFFGTSQGGGGALMLASLYRGDGVRCVAADVAFLTHFLSAPVGRAYHIAWNTLPEVEPAVGWRALGLIDTVSHAPRLDIPVLLTAGGVDETCPPESIEHLFQQLPGTRSYTWLKDVPHRYTGEFLHLASTWFRLYA